jgi:hypothetical protein
MISRRAPHSVGIWRLYDGLANDEMDAIMLKALPPAVLLILLAASGSALAFDCAPHCDYVHDYGPYDMSWVSPGLVGYPICDWQGNCSPHLVYRRFGRPWGIEITVRPTHRAQVR